jgi:hypothetical protein
MVSVAGVTVILVGEKQAFPLDFEIEDGDDMWAYLISESSNLFLMVIFFFRSTKQVQGLK